MFNIYCLHNRGKTAVEDLSAVIAAALGSVMDMPKHFCELQLHELGLRYDIHHFSI